MRSSWHCKKFLFDSQLLRNSVCESLRSLAHSNCVNFNQAALRTVLKPENMSSSAKQICLRFVCVYALNYASFYRPVSNRFSRCLDHCFHLFRSLFESISIAYKTLELNYFVFETFCLLPFLASVSRPQGPLISNYVRFCFGQSRSFSTQLDLIRLYGEVMLFCFAFFHRNKWFSRVHHFGLC